MFDETGSQNNRTSEAVFGHPLTEGLIELFAEFLFVGQSGETSLLRWVGIPYIMESSVGRVLPFGRWTRKLKWRTDSVKNIDQEDWE